MSKLVHKYGDAQIGHIVTLKSGGPDMTVVKFVPASSPPIPDGLQNAQWSDSETSLDAQVMWVTADGALGQANIPVAALVFKDDGGDEVDAKQRALAREPGGMIQA